MSYEVVVWVKRILNFNKVGYGGMLDLKVSGVFLVVLERVIRVV